MEHFGSVPRVVHLEGFDCIYLGSQEVEASVDIFHFLYPEYTFVWSAHFLSGGDLKELHQFLVITHVCEQVIDLYVSLWRILVRISGLSVHFKKHIGSNTALSASISGLTCCKKPNK